MKIIKSIIAIIGLLPLCVSAQNCEIHLMVAPVEQPADLPTEINDLLMQRITNVVSFNGVTATPDFDQFFVSGKINHLYKDVVPGPPINHVLNSMLTLYIGDAQNKKVYATLSMDIKGVGTSEQRAYINALSTLNGKNTKIAQFLESGKQKIITYYNNNYQNILAQAERALALKKYEEAMFLSTSIPQCCTGRDAADKLTLKIFKQFINNDCIKLLMQARSAWAISPDSDGAATAMAFLMQIDPDASCYGDALTLQNEMKKTVKSNWDFENREKYHDSVDLDKQIIAAARAVGVAYGNGQKAQTTNIMWLK